MNDMTAATTAPASPEPTTEEKVARFVELDRKYGEIKTWLDEYKQAKAAVVNALGIDSYFQDDQGIVYKTATIDGKFVYFDSIDIKRTKRDGERAGSLSVKEATEAGFTVN